MLIRPILMAIREHAYLRHLGQPGFTGVFLEALVAPEKSAGHGGWDDQRVEGVQANRKTSSLPAKSGRYRW